MKIKIENDERLLAPLAERLCISWVSYQAGVKYQTIEKQMKDVQMGSMWMDLADVVFDYVSRMQRIRDAEKKAMATDAPIQ